MQLLLRILLNCALVLAFVQAPLVHVHQHEAANDHPGAFLHSHFAHPENRPSTQAELRDFDPDNDAQFQNWFSPASGDEGFNPVVVVLSICPESPRLLPYRVETIEPDAHGPPDLAALPPRAPPA